MCCIYLRSWVFLLISLQIKCVGEAGNKGVEGQREGNWADLRG